jgi:hypothetical protein
MVVLGAEFNSLSNGAIFIRDQISRIRFLLQEFCTKLLCPAETCTLWQKLTVFVKKNGFGEKNAI